MKTPSKPEEQPGLVRKELYRYLEAEGFTVTDERHNKIKSFMRDHTARATAANTRDLMQMHNALQNVKIPPKVKRIADRLTEHKCILCGVDMINRGNGEYITKCGHLTEHCFTYA